MPNKREMTLKEVWRKYKALTPLTNKELCFLIHKLDDLENQTAQLGMEYKISRRSLSLELATLKGFALARKLKWEKRLED